MFLRCSAPLERKSHTLVITRQTHTRQVRDCDYHRVSTTSSDFSSCGFDCVNFYGLATENDNSLLVSS